VSREQILEQQLISVVFHCILMCKLLSPAKCHFLKQNELVFQSVDIFEAVFKENLMGLSYCRASCAALFTLVSDKAMAGMPQLVHEILSLI